jgi:glucose-6-phosphate 1-dehydrogenase
LNRPTKGVSVCRSDALVLFGATGDLARKKLFSSLYALAAHGRLDMPVVGVALSDWDDDRFRLHVREAIASTVTNPDPGDLTYMLGSSSGGESQA